MRAAIDHPAMRFPETDISNLPVSSVTETALEMLNLAGARALDIGCGTGFFTLFLARHCAAVAGVDPNESRIATARAAASDAGLAIDFKVGVAEALPFGDAAFDIVAFSNSLHHVAIAQLSAAMREAARVLVPGGLLWVAEPLPSGGHYELRRGWNAEDDIRRAAYEALRQASVVGLELTREVFFSHPTRYANFEAYVADRSVRSVRNASGTPTRFAACLRATPGLMVTATCSIARPGSTCWRRKSSARPLRAGAGR